MTTHDFEALASQYGLDVDFVHQLHEKVVDKENFARAVKMFADGTLPFDVATGDAPINVASIRHDVAVNMWNARIQYKISFSSLLLPLFGCIGVGRRGVLLLNRDFDRFGLLDEPVSLLVRQIGRAHV